MCIKQGIICYEWSCNLMTCDVMEETPESSGRAAWWGSQAVDSIATNTVSSFVMSITVVMIIWWYNQKLQFDICVSGLQEQTSAIETVSNIKTSFNNTGKILPRMHLPHLLTNQFLKTFSTPVRWNSLCSNQKNHRWILGHFVFMTKSCKYI